MIRVLALGAALAALTTGADQDNELTASVRNPREVDASRSQVFALQWRRPMVRTGMYRTVGTSFGAPGLSRVHNVVVVGSGEGDVRALSLVDGTAVWSYAHPVPFESSVAMVDATTDPNGEPDELAILGSREGALLALEVATGKLRWQATLEGDPRAPVRRVDSKLLATTAKNKIFVLDLHSGEVQWSKGRPPPTGLSVTGVARASEHNGLVFACYSDGYVEAYRLEDGSSVWSRPLSIRGGEFVDADADPVVVNGKLIVASYSDGIYALDPEDGQTSWQRAAPSVTRLARLDNLVIAASADGYVWGLGSRDGALIYRTRLPPGPVARLHVRDGLVATTAGESGLVVFDGRSGKPMQAAVYGDTFAGDLAWNAKDAAFLASSGYLYALRQVVE